MNHKGHEGHKAAENIHLRPDAFASFVPFVPFVVPI
jgi:hypothetical protein